MLVVKRIDIIFNKYTPGRDGRRYELVCMNMILSGQFRARFILCTLLCCVLPGCLNVCVGELLGQWRVSAPAAPCKATSPFPSFSPSCPLVPTDWTTCSPFMPPVHQLDCTLGSLCHWALELTLAAFVWILVKSPLLPPAPVFLSHSVFFSFALCAVLYKHRHTHTH